MYWDQVLSQNHICPITRDPVTGSYDLIIIVKIRNVFDFRVTSLLKVIMS